MRPKKCHFLILIGIVIALGSVSLFKKVTLLQLKNKDQQRALQIRINPSDRFYIFYINSIYNEPVIEEFQATKDTIVLKGVRTKSPKVLEYYGFEDIKDFIPVNREMEIIFLRVGMGRVQDLIYKNRKVSFIEIGSKGDQIQLMVKSVPVGYYLLSILFKDI